MSTSSRWLDWKPKPSDPRIIEDVHPHGPTEPTKPRPDDSSVSFVGAYDPTFSIIHAAADPTAAEVIALAESFGADLSLRTDGSLRVSWPDCVEGTHGQRRLLALLKERDKQVRAELLAQGQTIPVPDPFEVEACCPCEFRRYPHIVSTFDPATRRRHDRQLEAHPLVLRARIAGAEPTVTDASQTRRSQR